MVNFMLYFHDVISLLMHDKKQFGMKMIVYDTTLQGRKKEMGGIRNNKTEGITTLNVVMKEVFI